MTARLPFDADTEASVLAELADPLHDDGSLRETITADQFFDRRNARIFDAVLVDVILLSDSDRRYLANVVRFAFPVVAGTVARFVDLAARRRRLVELEAERDALLSGAGLS